MICRISLGGPYHFKHKISKLFALLLVSSSLFPMPGIAQKWVWPWTPAEQVEAQKQEKLTPVDTLVKMPAVPAGTFALVDKLSPMYIKGVQDMRTVQVNHFRPGQAVFITTSLFFPVGCTMCGIMYATPEPMENHWQWDYDHPDLQDVNYRAGYTAELQRYKRKALVKNVLIGFWVNVVVIIIAARSWVEITG